MVDCQLNHKHDGSKGPCVPYGVQLPPRWSQPPTARLRILPIYNQRDADPSHYVVVDRCFGIRADEMTAAAEKLRQVVPVPVLIFAFEVDLPDVDETWQDGDEELVPLHRPDGSEI